MMLQNSILGLLALCISVGGMGTEAHAFQKITKDGIVQALGSTRGIKKIGTVPVTGEQAKPQVALQLQFDLNSASLRPEAVMNLNKVAAALEDESLRTFKFAIEGHTCNLGSAEHNLELSKRRAYAVTDFLTSHSNLSPEQFEVDWHGEICPAVGNIDENARRINRRVVIKNTLETPEVSLQGRPATLEIIRYRNGQQEIVSDGDTLISNSSYSVSFKSDVKQYAYVCQMESSGDVVMLFPNSDYSSRNNPVEPGLTYRIPEKDGKGFYLDETTGTEQLAMVVLDMSVQDPRGVCTTIFQIDAAIQRGIGGVGGIRPVSNSKPVAATGHDLRLCEVMQGGRTRGIGGVSKIEQATSSSIDYAASQKGSCQGFFLKRFFIHK